ncbi:MAG TPA: RsmB/NOP family class I SAM-dependent RNA methyltransferase [Anaeromyxobacteraceae bacterium]|nr:RsmB/NOP family class I SAM-dependent RNA methyltransferase [Anaeromyxobacteraceae bacterium]
MRAQEDRASAGERRLGSVPWGALAGLGPALDGPLGEVLAGAPAERVLDRFLRANRGLSREARQAVKEAVFGVAVWRRRLAWQAGASPSTSMPPAVVLLALLLRDLARFPGPAALLGLDPRLLPPPRPPPADLATRHSLPDWLAATLEREAGAEAAALADALNLPGPVALRPNLLRTTPVALARRLAAEGVEARPGALVPSALVVTSLRPNLYGLGALREGLFEVQDEGSQRAGALLAARPGERVLDLCAGAGGKALQLAADVGAGGAVHACDPDAERLARLAVRARRAGAAGIVRIEGAAPPGGLTVDAALVDAPCSELGALRRGPDARFRIDPGSFAALPALQLELLRAAARHVRPGGRLVYATCTLRREEDEDVALAFSRAEPAFQLAEASRTWPHRQGCDGFYMALFQRKNS